MKQLGRHLIIEFWEATELNDAEALALGMKECVEAIDGTLLHSHVEQFPVHGVTGVAVIAESHVAVHTWPEYGYAAVDIFTCNLEADIQAGIDALKRRLLPGSVQIFEVRRGIMP